MYYRFFITNLINGVRQPEAVSVRETHFGYIIRSYKPNRFANLIEQSARFAMVALWVAAIAIWPLADAPILTKLMISAVMFIAGYAVLTLTRLPSGKTELHVDTNRRELRSAVVTAKGESWIRSSARFGEIAELVLRHCKSDEAKQRLSLRIVGEDEEMPIAIGAEPALLAIHDRIVRDLRPLESQMCAHHVAKRPTRLEPRAAFPDLGPVEVAA